MFFAGTACESSERLRRCRSSFAVSLGERLRRAMSFCMLTRRIRDGRDAATFPDVSDTVSIVDRFRSGSSDGLRKKTLERTDEGAAGTGCWPDPGALAPSGVEACMRASTCELLEPLKT